MIFSVSPPVQSSDCRRPTSTSKKLVYELRKNTARTATRRDAELNEIINSPLGKQYHPWLFSCYVSTSPSSPALLRSRGAEN